MTKYIIEYVGGTKGDLLIRFLNKHTSNIKQEDYNRTNPVDIGVPNWLKLTSINQQSVERHKIVFQKNKHQYVGAHEQRETFGKNKKYDDLLEKYNYKIIKIIFDEKYYRTIVLESLAKNFVTLNENESDFIVKKLNLFSIYKRNYDLIKYKLNLSLDDSLLHYDNRIKIFKLLVEDIDNSRIYFRYKNFNKNNMDNKILINYEDLFITKNISQYNLFDGYDKEEFFNLVDKSWCPDIITIEGLTINLKDHGYKIY